MDRILIIPPNDLFRHPIPNRLFHIAKRLAEWYEVLVLSYPNHPLARSKMRSLKAKDIRYKTFKLNNLGLYYLINTPSFYVTLKHLSDVDAVIHANIVPSLLATRIFAGKKIYDYVDHFPESAAAYYQGTLKRVVKYLVSQIVIQSLRGSDLIVTPSYGLAAFIRGYTNRPVYVIENGVDPELFRPLDITQARKEIGIDYEGPIFLLQGSIDVWLNVEPIMYALKKSEDVRLLLVGYSHGKHYYHRLENLWRRLGLTRRIYKYPPQPYERMPVFINASNGIIAPYIRSIGRYATPLKVIESLACGRPVLATRISEFWIWFKRGMFYYDHDDIWKLFGRIVRDWDLIYRELIDYSSVIRRVYSWGRIAERYRSLIESWGR
ncbi:MAG: glycosyltransferase [Candidatus Korarchaeum sp.]